LVTYQRYELQRKLRFSRRINPNSYIFIIE